MATDRDDRRLAAPGELELVRDFVNTRDLEKGTDRIDDPGALSSWLFRRGLVPGLPEMIEEDVGRIQDLREALRALLLANAGFPFPAGSAEAFEDSVRCVRLRPHAGEAGWLELLPADADGLNHAIGRLVSIVFAAQENGTWPRLKACAECRWALYDHTKNRSAAWCSSQCGTRVRARRHRRRHRGDFA
jgi:predicted RNA-binding Zn ribbon-like protein